MTVVVVQARMASTRLPGKVLRDLGGRPVLSWVIRAVRAAGVGPVVVATTTSARDDGVADLAARERVGVVRGSEEDVLSRFLVALEPQGDDDVVVRVTGDCPLLDPELVQLAVGAFAGGHLDYLSTVLEQSLPRGEDVEVTRVGLLREIDPLATGAHRAHVTSYLYAGRTDLRVAGLVFRPAADDLRVTLDTPEDAEVIERLVAALGDRPPAWRELVAHLRAHPELAAVNASIRQKALDEG